MSIEKQSTRLIVNFSVTLLRMLTTVGITLVVTRIVLNELGQSDFGIYTAIVASAAILSVLIKSLHGGTARQMSVEIGKNDSFQLAIVFNSTLMMFLVAALIVLLLGFTGGPFILDLLSFPAEREYAASWAYYLSVVNIAVTILFVPHDAILIAKQEIVVTSLFELCEVLGRLLAALILLVSSTDLLILYVSILLAIGLLLRVARAAICTVRIPESRVRLSLASRAVSRQIYEYCRWLLLDMVAAFMRHEAIVVMINIRFGAVITAAYGVARQLAMYQGNVAGTLMRAFSPAMVSYESSGDRRKMLRIGLLGDKYTLLLLSLFLVPLWIETPFIIRLWLGENNYDSDVLLFTRILLTWFTIPIFTRAYPLGLTAIGRIRNYTILSVIVVALVLLIGGYFLFYLDWPAWTLPATSVAGAVTMTIINLSYVRGEIGLPIRQWFTVVLLPVVLIIAIGTLPAVWIHFQYAEGLLRLLAVTALYALVSIPFMWLIGVDSSEKEHFTRVIRSALNSTSKNKVG